MVEASEDLLEIEEDEEDLSSEDTWKKRMNEEVTDSDIINIEDRKSYISKKISFEFYDKSRAYLPKTQADSSFEVFKDLEELNIRDRLKRNMKKVETKEQELFSMFHSYKGL